MMPNRDDILGRLREQTGYLATQFGVRRLGLFGSFAKGSQSAGSDVDLLVEFDRPIGLRFIELAEYLESILGRKVDLLTPAGIQSARRNFSKSIYESIIYVEAL